MNQEIEKQVKELVPAELYGVISGAFRDNLETTEYPLALKFKPETEFKSFELIFQSLHFFNVAYQWWLGDALNFGENKYGEKYAQAVENPHLLWPLPASTERCSAPPSAPALRAAG